MTNYQVWSVKTFLHCTLIVSETAEEPGVHPSMSLVSTKSYWPQADVYGEKMMVYDPESRKRVILHILVIYYFTVIYCKFVGTQMKLVNTFTFHLNM